MFGTLIVQLPSAYEGGQLRVKHAKKEHIFDFSGLKGSTGFHYVALYADCQHELCVVTKGYRLCLVYNLIHTGSGYCPAPIDNSLLVTQVVDAMKEWIGHPGSNPPMIAIPLAHKYCEASLSFSGLKNADRAMADLLRVATCEVTFDVYLGMIQISQHWCGGVRYYGFDADDFLGQEIEATNLVSPEGKKVKNLSVQDEMFKPEGALDKILKDEPENEEVNEATGNEGATMDRWYSQAALLLWPEQNRFKVLGLDTMVKQLSDSIAKACAPRDQNSAKWQECYSVCQKLISLALSQRPSAETATTLLSSAVALGDCTLVSTLLGPTSANSATESVRLTAVSFLSSSKFVDALLLACSTFSWSSLQPCLSKLMETDAAQNVESCVQLLYRLVTLQPSLTPELQAMGQELALPVCKVLVEEQNLTSDPAASWCSRSRRVRSQEFVCSLLKTLSLLDCTTQMETLLIRFLALPIRYPLETVLVPAVEEFDGWSGKKSNAVLGFAASGIEKLEASIKVPIEEPTNWAQDSTIMCKCQDCVELQSFLEHRSKTSARFKMKESRRSHLEHQIRANDCDCMCRTEYAGIPRTLVVTKTRMKLARKKQERETSLQLLSRLKVLCGRDVAKPSAKRACFIDLTLDD